MAYRLVATVATPSTTNAAYYFGGSIWAAASSSVYRINPATAAITATITSTPAISGQFVEDQYGYLWFMGTGRVLVRIDPATNTTTSVTVFTSGTSAPSLSFADGDLWVQLQGISGGAANRVFRIDPSTFVVTDTGNAICGGSLCSFFVEQGGYVWASTTTFLGMNILKVDPATNTVTTTTNVTASILPFFRAIYSYGYLWCSTANGMLRFNTSSLASNFFTAMTTASVGNLVDDGTNLYYDESNDLFSFVPSTQATAKIIDLTSLTVGLFDTHANNFWISISSGSGTTLQYGLAGGIFTDGASHL